jgi:hypothetical protein
MTPLFMTHLKTAHFSSVFSPTDENQQQNIWVSENMPFFSCSEFVGNIDQCFQLDGSIYLIRPVVTFKLKVREKMG